MERTSENERGYMRMRTSIVVARAAAAVCDCVCICTCDRRTVSRGTWLKMAIVCRLVWCRSEA